MTSPWPEGLVVLLPVHRQPALVRDVVAGLRAAGAPVLVVADACDEDTRKAADTAGAQVHSLASGRGTAAAVRQGIAQARSAGFIRAVVCLIGGAQAPAAIREFVTAAAGPEAVTLGTAAGTTSGPWSRAWIRLCTGVRLGDARPRLAIYPLDAISSLPVRSRCGGWQTELLVRAAWSGVPLHQTFVGGLGALDSVDRRLTWGERGWGACIGPALALRRLWPWGMAPGPTRLRTLVAANLSPGKAAGACALGAALGIAPIPGLQMFVAATLAYWLRLNVALTLLVSNHSFGPMLAVWYAFATALGLRLLTGQPLQLAFVTLHHRLAAASSLRMILAPLRECLAAWMLGSVLLMPVVALVAACAGYLFARMLRRR